MRGYYVEAVEFIALNDEPEELDPESIAGFISTIAVAVSFRKEPLEVAQKVARFRRRPSFQAWLRTGVMAGVS